LININRRCARSFAFLLFQPQRETEKVGGEQNMTFTFISENHTHEISIINAHHPRKGNTDIMSFNRIQVLGNLTRDPELRYTPQGTPVCTLNIASNNRARDPKTKEYTDTPTFFRGTAWGQRAEAIAQHFERGSEIFIEGKFKPEEWTDREGRLRTTFGIQVSDFNFTGGSNRNRTPSSPAGTGDTDLSGASAQETQGGGEPEDDDIDFS